MCFGINRFERTRNEPTNRRQDSFDSSLFTLNEKKGGYDVELEFNSGDEKEGFSSEGVSYSTVKDVRDTVLALQQQRSMSSRYQHFGRKVEPILDFCTKYTGVMNTIAQVDGSAMLIWGALKAVIEIARTSIAYFSFIENALTKLGDTLSLTHEYEKMLGEQVRVRVALTNLYDEIYLFVKRLQLSVSASSWTVFLKNIKRSYDAEFKNSLDQVERYIAKFNDEVTLAHRQGLARSITDLSENSSAILDKVTSKEAQESEVAILQWLKAVDADADLQRVARRRTPGTGAWFLNHESLKTWETPKNNKPVIWINGPPGFGKTVLSSHLIQHLQSSHKPNLGIYSAPTVLYFYCDSGDSERKTSLDVYAAILSQIVMQTRSVPVYLLDAYERAKKYSRSHVSDSDNMSTALKEAIKNLSAVYIVLDGLDECENPNEVISVFDDIARSSTTCRLACFSRKLPSIEKVLCHAISISLDSSVVQYDINTYLLQAVGDLPTQSKGLHQEIVQTVSEKADGMFLFAYLNVQALKLTVNQEGMMSAFAKIPNGLDGIYSGIISRISSQDVHRQQLAYKTLLWVSCSTRPLMWRELQYALSWDETDRTFSEDRRPFKDAVLELCSPLIEYRADKDTFHLTHYSLYEYLMNTSEKSRLPQAAQRFILDQPKAHQEMSYALLTCLSSKALARTVKVDAVQNPLASYATTEWCHHLSSSEYTPDLFQTYNVFTSAPIQRSVWIMRFLLLNRQSFPLQKITKLQKSVRSWEHNVKETSTYFVEDLIDIQRALIGLDHFDSNVKAETISTFERDLIVRDLARSYTMAGKLEQGIAMFTTALKRSQTGTGEQTYEHAWLLNSLGILYDQQGKTELAKSLQEQALRCQERSLPQDHLDITLTVNELGRMARHLGQYQEAETYHLQALRTLRLHLPDSDLQIIWTINTLARSYRREGRLEEAINLHRQALEGQQKTLGEDHPHTLWTMGDIARCLRDQGQYAGAVEIISKVHDSRQRVLGPLHPDTLWTLNDLGLLYCSLGDKDNARTMHQRAYDGQVQVLGISHAHTKWTAEELSKLV